MELVSQIKKLKEKQDVEIVSLQSRHQKYADSFQVVWNSFSQEQEQKALEKIEKLKDE
jgi:hypothetical protein